MSRLRKLVLPWFLLASLLAAQTRPASPESLAKKADPPAAGGPKTAADLQPGTYKYQAKILVGPQQISLNLSTTIKEENGAWTVTDVVETPQGKAQDTATLEKGTLLLRKRSVTQGQMAVKIDYAGDKATGSINMGGNDTALLADLGGPLFADGPGAPQSVATLPLAIGYTTSFRTLDIQRQKVRIMQLKVADSESVTVPAGTFDTFRVEISSDGEGGKTTLWIAKDSHKAVKVSSVQAQAGGAAMTAELLP